MPLSITIDNEKLVSALCYISAHSKNRDLIHILKILYFAEKNHLQNYGRFICGSTYSKMKYGPVPSEAYNILKALDGRSDSNFAQTNPDVIAQARTLIGVEKAHSYPLFYAVQEPDTDALSRSDLNCLDAAIEEIGPMGFGDLTLKSHDEVWDAADQAKTHIIPLEMFLSALPNKDAIFELLAERG
jgi:uncharacterized phage-associated protein